MSELSEVRFIGFDADQTLWDFSLGMKRAIGAVVAEIELLSPVSPTAMTSQRLMAIRDEIVERQGAQLDLARVRWFAFEQALREVNLPTEGLTRRLYEVYFANRSRPSDRYADTNQVLERLSAAGYRLAVLTNGNGDLSEYGIAEVFEVVLRAEEVGYAKPDPRYFAAAQKVAGLLPHQMLLVGDDLEHDVRGAQEAGWQAIWLNKSGAATPEWVQRPAISSLGDLVEVLG